MPSNTDLNTHNKKHSESTNLRRSGGSGFRTLDSRIRSVIRIATKIVSLGPLAMPYPSKKFCQNPFTSLRVIRQTDRQTNRPHRKQPPSSAEVINVTTTTKTMTTTKQSLTSDSIPDPVLPLVNHFEYTPFVSSTPGQQMQI